MSDSVDIQRMRRLSEFKIGNTNSEIKVLNIDPWSNEQLSFLKYNLPNEANEILISFSNFNVNHKRKAVVEDAIIESCKKSTNWFNTEGDLSFDMIYKIMNRCNPSRLQIDNMNLFEIRKLIDESRPYSLINLHIFLEKSNLQAYGYQKVVSELSQVCKAFKNRKIFPNLGTIYLSNIGSVYQHIDQMPEIQDCFNFLS